MSTPARPRIDYPKFTAAMSALHAAVEDGPLEVRLLQLVRIRASHLSGCGFCLNLHTETSRAAGETQQRLDLVAAWREAGGLFTDRERATLAVTDAVTMLAGRGVPDEVLDAAEPHFDDKELSVMLYAVTEINAWNRLAVTARTRPRRG